VLCNRQAFRSVTSSSSIRMRAASRSGSRWGGRRVATFALSRRPSILVDIEYMKTLIMLKQRFVCCPLDLVLLVLAGISAPAQTCTYFTSSPLPGFNTFTIFPSGSYNYLDYEGQVYGLYYESRVVFGMGFSIQMECDTDPGTNAPAVYELQVTFRPTVFFTRAARSTPPRAFMPTSFALSKSPRGRRP
jgi:hypothetical protein